MINEVYSPKKVVFNRNYQNFGISEQINKMTSLTWLMRQFVSDSFELVLGNHDQQWLTNTTSIGSQIPRLTNFSGLQIPSVTNLTSLSATQVYIDLN